MDYRDYMGYRGYHIAEYAQVGSNLYRRGDKYFRLFGRGITPNYCWIIAPELRELVEFDIATGKDVYGSEVVKFGACGEIESDLPFIAICD